VIIDCLTLYVSNLICGGKTEKYITKNVQNLLSSLKDIDYLVIFVSNEVGSGIVPLNKLARDFRDIAGKVNQLVAQQSDEAYYMVSGLKIKLK
jgi:adenosylcobinamide kinase/adenosylcobinamide-phosphate guanylyltransferase